MAITRRRFLEGAALAGAASGALAAAQNSLPTRVLGRTGAKVSILAFGGGSRFLMFKEEEQGLEALNRALSLGISYIDTAYSYGNGASEQRIGKLMKTRRKDVFLATKIPDRGGDAAMRRVEGCLERLQTDHVDLLHIHSLGDEKDLAAIEAPDGVLKVLYRLREQKVARAIGVTCHTDPAVLKTALERHDFDCTQMALNAALMGSGPSALESARTLENSFESVALPVAVRKKMGVIGMKVYAQEKLIGKAPTDRLLRYTLSLPVTAAVVGMPTLEYLGQNIEWARGFRPMPPAEMREMSRGLAVKHKAAIDRFFLNHVDA